MLGSGCAVPPPCCYAYNCSRYQPIPIEEAPMWIRFAFAALLLTTPAMAQPVPDQAIRDFVDSHSAVTHLGKIARWEEGVCPSVTGLPANFVKYINKRIRDLPASVGAPVNADETCKSNISIVFTTKPQDLLNSIREKQPV